MITFPMNQHAALVVIEPTNIAKLRRGEPLIIKYGGVDIAVCFTPDYFQFLRSLGVPDTQSDVKRGEKAVFSTNISADELTGALEACKNLPDVER